MQTRRLTARGSRSSTTAVPVSAPTFLFAPCRPTLRLSFATPQASVQLMARALVLPATELVARAHGSTGVTLGQATVVDPSSWKPVSLSSPDGDGVDRLRRRARGRSERRRRRSRAVRAPAAGHVRGRRTGVADAKRATRASSFGANRPGRAARGAARSTARRSRRARRRRATAACAAGPHTFRVATVDGYGAVDASPAAAAWTVLGPPPETQVPAGAQPVVRNGTATLDLGLTALFECSVDGGGLRAAAARRSSLSGLAPGPAHARGAVGGRGRARRPHARRSGRSTSRRSRRCSRARSRTSIADRSPTPQEAAAARQRAADRGRARPRAADLRHGLRQAAGAQRGLKQQLAGFVPLKGVAALPIGTIVDARRGTLGLETAADGRAATDPLRRLSRSRVVGRDLPDPPGAACAGRRCAHGPSRPSSLLVTPAGGRRRAAAGNRRRRASCAACGPRRKASSACPAGGSFGVGRDATWRTIDRCGSTTT